MVNQYLRNMMLTFFRINWIEWIVVMGYKICSMNLAQQSRNRIERVRQHPIECFLTIPNSNRSYFIEMVE